MPESLENTGLSGILTILQIVAAPHLQQVRRETQNKIVANSLKCAKLRACLLTFSEMYDKIINEKDNLTGKKRQNAVTVEQIFLSGDNLEHIVPKENKLTFMYSDVEKLCFMAPNTFDMTEVSASGFEWEKNFLTTDLTVSCSVYESEVISIKLPDDVHWP